MESVMGRCVHGHEGRERVWSIRTYGPALQEIVARREFIREVSDPSIFAGKHVVRRATVEARDLPPFALYAVEQSRCGGQRLCGDCRRQVKDVVVSWLCQTC